MTGKAHEANETTKRTPVANRKFKDTVFRMLFSDKEALLSFIMQLITVITRIPVRLKLQLWKMPFTWE